METYGDRLKAARKTKGYSRPQLAKICGLTDRTIQNYENGSSNPKTEITQKLATALDVSVDYLINGTEEVDLTEEDQKEILEKASALFAGGKLSQDDQLAFLNELQTIYLDSKRRSQSQNDQGTQN